MTTRTSVAEKLRTGLILFVALAALGGSFVINRALRPLGSEATYVGHLADAGIRQNELTRSLVESGAADGDESQP